MAAIRTSNSAASCLVGLSLLFPRHALADERGDTSGASRHFERGYLAAQQGSLEEAIREFESAYALSPKPSVLYNLGQAYAASGRAVEAVRTLGKYLEQSDPAADAERRAKAAALIDYQRQRVGTLVLEVEPAGAEIVLDGVLLGKAPLPEPVPVTAGVHGLSVNAAGRVPRSLRLEVAGRGTLRQRVELQPEAASSRTVSCSVPDVTVTADGIKVATLPLGGRIAIPGGTSELRFERFGFIPSRVQPPAETVEVIACGLGAIEPRADLIPVAVEVPYGFELHVNGQLFRGGALPSGRHLFTSFGRGLGASQKLVEVGPGARRTETLIADEGSPRLQQERATRRRWHLYSAAATVGVGVVGLGVASVLYAINRDAYATWRRDGAELATRASAAPGNVDVSEWNGLLERENALRNRDSVVLGSALLGGAFLAAGAALWWTAPAQPARRIEVRIGKVSWIGYAARF
jgi:Tetratricopeptide repeat